jgi:hypothetical protein
MEFTEIQKEALFQAKRLYPKGKGFVPVEEAVSDCEELVDASWLRTETEENGDVSYYWTQQAETALDLNNLTDLEGREN